jgi:hypothetical protein
VLPEKPLLLATGSLVFLHAGTTSSAQPPIRFLLLSNDAIVDDLKQANSNWSRKIDVIFMSTGFCEIGQI